MIDTKEAKKYWLENQLRFPPIPLAVDKFIHELVQSLEEKDRLLERCKEGFNAILCIRQIGLENLDLGRMEGDIEQLLKELQDNGGE